MFCQVLPSELIFKSALPVLKLNEAVETFELNKALAETANIRVKEKADKIIRKSFFIFKYKKNII